MQRLFGTIAILAGWLSIPIGAVSGLVASQFFGLSHVEGDLAPSAVYGISGAVVLWTFVGAAFLAALPVLRAVVATDPRRPVRLLAAAMLIVGLALVPDELGRAFGLPLVAGAACMWVGGDLIRRESVSAATAVPADAQTPADGVEDPAAMETTPRPSPAGESAAPAAQPAPGRGGRRSARKRDSGQRICPWCSAQVPAGAATCPNCQAMLDEPTADGFSIPGLTEVQPSLRRYAEDVKSKKKRPSVLGIMFSDTQIPPAVDPPAPSDAAALQPPSAAIKAEMARLDAEIASGEMSFDASEPPAEPGEPSQSPPNSPSR